MSTLRLRRAFLIVPIALVLAGCGGGQGKPGVPPGLGEMNPAAGEAPLLQPASSCQGTEIQATRPCQGEDVGSECTPPYGTVVAWTGSTTTAPQFTWTYPCDPEKYEVSLSRDRGFGMSFEFLEARTLTADDSDEGVPPSSWLPANAHLLHGATRYAYTLRAVKSGISSEPGTVYFWTGPMCPGLSPDSPDLLWPADDAIISLPEASSETVPTFVWQTNWSDCLVNWAGGISTSEDFSEAAQAISVVPPWNLEGGPADALELCRTYYWRVAARYNQNLGPWSETRSFRIVPPGGESLCDAETVMAIPTQDSSCRLGPSTAYAIASYVPVGERHPVEGRNAAGTWLKLQDLGCYIYRELLALEVGATPFPGGADVSDLMSVLPDPPLPTETPLPVCMSTMGPDECTRLGGTWIPYAGIPGGKCDCP